MRFIVRVISDDQFQAFVASEELTYFYTPLIAFSALHPLVLALALVLRLMRDILLPKNCNFLGLTSAL